MVGLFVLGLRITLSCGVGRVQESELGQRPVGAVLPSAARLGGHAGDVLAVDALGVGEGVDKSTAGVVVVGDGQQVAHGNFSYWSSTTPTMRCASSVVKDASMSRYSWSSLGLYHPLVSSSIMFHDSLTACFVPLILPSKN